MLSVILCTYQPRVDYLRRTLAALDAQTLPVAEWELLIVDNASPEPLEETALAGMLTRSFRLVREPTPGLARARITGCREALGDCLVYVDDDNLLASDYLASAAAIARTHPFLGAWSGHLEGEFEAEPAPEVSVCLPMLALREVRQERWANFPHFDVCPWGAGMCLRRQVVEAYAENFDEGFRARLGAKATSLSRGEDTDLAFTACHEGLGIGLFPQLRLTHLMPAERLRREYLLRLAAESTYANVIIAYVHGLGLPGTPTLRGKLRQQLRGLLSGRSFAWQVQQAERAAIARALDDIEHYGLRDTQVAGEG